MRNLAFYSSTMLRAVRSICLVLFLFFTSNFQLFQPNKTVSALGNETDYSALLRFKESISSDPFGVLTSWNTSSHFCNWHGVTCSHKHQRVTELNLTGYSLHGFISPHLGNLSFLRLLNLAANSFYGELPQEFGSLGKLETFTVRSNNLTGNIQPSIGNLSSLNFLSMSYNNLEGTIPKEIGLLKNLATIFVAANKFSGMLPSSLYNLSSLTRISITYNQFNGSLPPNMFLTLPNLMLIAVGLNKFSGPIPTSINNASRIQLLDIGDNYFVGKVPSLEKLQDLSFLNLGSYCLGRSSPNDLGFLKSLMNCSQLSVLDITNNYFVGPLPNFIGNFSTQLRELYLGGNQISGKIPMELGNLVNLILLTMEANQLTEAIPATFGKFQKMQKLNLARNKLSEEMPTFIGNLSQLIELNLSHNMLIGNIPSTIGNCRNLQMLDLSQNNLSGAIPSQIFGLSSLSISLDLSHNSLSGSLPVEVGILKQINKLDVSGNYLSGDIPETIGECTSLEYLYLQGNSLQGIMPPSLALLNGLRKLDVSRNNLSGLVPVRLQNISGLEYFNASFNMLEGEVPTDGVFQNASAISVVGNDKLCGGVSELKLPACPLKATRQKKHNNLQVIVAIICSTVTLLVLSCILAIYMIRKNHRIPYNNSMIEQLPKVDQLPRVPYHSLHLATDGFSVRNLIGIGSLGSVYKGRLDSEERVVAVKVLNLRNKGAHKSFIAECNALKNIRHRNLVKILTCCSSVDYKGEEFKALILEYMPNGSLEKWLHPEKEHSEEPKILNLEKRLEIIVDVASVLQYLHYECEQPVIHCDLKPSNVLLDGNMVAHVSDFGLARLLSTTNDNFQTQTSVSGIKGTIGYAPPEYGMSSQVSTEGDMYSFGILILEMLTGRGPTEDIFKDGQNLHNYVKTAFPNNILEVVDVTLLSMENEYPIVTVEEENNSFDITASLQPNVQKSLLSLFRIGLSCSANTPSERMNVMQVIKELNLIRHSFFT